MTGVGLPADPEAPIYEELRAEDEWKRADSKRHVRKGSVRARRLRGW